MANELRTNSSATTSLMSSWKPNLNKYTFSRTLLCSMTLILVGLDAGNGTNTAVKLFMGKLNSSDARLLSYSFIFIFVSPLASLAAGRTSNWIGLRYTLLLSLLLFFFGSLITSFSRSYAVFIFGRVVVATGIGYTQMVVPVYIVELSPESTRGFLTSFVDIFVTLGTLLGDVLAYFISNNNLSENLSWRVMLGIGTIPSFLFSLFVIALPESPFWLVSRGKLGEAKRVLAKTLGSVDAAELRLVNLKSAAGVPDHCSNDVVSPPKPLSFAESFKKLVLRPSPSVKRALIAVVGLNFFRHATGVDAVKSFLPRILETAGIKNQGKILLATTTVRLINICLVLTAGFLMDRIGRRPLLLTSLAGMIPSLAGVGLGLGSSNRQKVKKIWAVALSLAMSLSFDTFFFIGLGPITWVYSSEIFPAVLRAQGASRTAVNWLTDGSTSMTFVLSLYEKVKIGGCFFIFAGVASVAWLYIYILVPETLEKKTSVNEVDQTGTTETPISEDHVAQSKSSISTALDISTFDDNNLCRR